MNRVFFLCFMFFALLLLPSCSQSPDHSVSEEASSTLPQSEQGQEGLTPSQSQENTPSSQGQQESSQKTESLGSSSNQGEWDSPSGRYPYTSQAVLDYYAAHPQWEEYYWEYLVPIGGMLTQEWSLDQPPTAGSSGRSSSPVPEFPSRSLSTKDRSQSKWSPLSYRRGELGGSIRL